MGTHMWMHPHRLSLVHTRSHGVRQRIDLLPLQYRGQVAARGRAPAGQCSCGGDGGACPRSRRVPAPDTFGHPRGPELSCPARALCTVHSQHTAVAAPNLGSCLSQNCHIMSACSEAVPACMCPAVLRRVTVLVRNCSRCKPAVRRAASRSHGWRTTAARATRCWCWTARTRRPRRLRWRPRCGGRSPARRSRWWLAWPPTRTRRASWRRCGGPRRSPSRSRRRPSPAGWPGGAAGPGCISVHVAASKHVHACHLTTALVGKPFLTAAGEGTQTCLSSVKVARPGTKMLGPGQRVLCACRSAAPGMLAAQWQAAGMAAARPVRSRELIKARAVTDSLECLRARLGLDLLFLSVADIKHQHLQRLCAQAPEGGTRLLHARAAFCMCYASHAKELERCVLRWARHAGISDGSSGGCLQ